MPDPSRSNPLVATPPRRAVAGAMAMTGFSIAVLAGLAAGNPVDEILLRSTICLFGCLAVGTVVGIFCEAAVTEYLKDFVNEHPVPDSEVEVEELALSMHRRRESDPADPSSDLSKQDQRNSN